MSETKKKLPLWPALIPLAMIVLLALISPVCRYIYTRQFVAGRDLQLAQMLYDNLTDMGITSFEKPMFFIGCGETVTNGSCLDLSTGQYDIYSIFAVEDALSLDTVASSQHIVSYLNQLGYQYTAPTAEDWTAYELELSEHIPLWKAFPWYESIMETEHCIIVQLEQVQIEW